MLLTERTLSTLPPAARTRMSALQNLFHNRKFRRLYQRLSTYAIANSHFNRIVTRVQTARVDQPRQRQTVSRGADAAPILDLFTYFLSVPHQRIFDVYRRTQSGLICTGVIDLHIDADWCSAMILSGEVGDYLLVPNHKLA